MVIYNRCMKSAFCVAVILCSAFPIAAQVAMPANGATAFRDTSSLKPPSGAKVAIVEYEDLECGFCAHAAPIVRAAVRQYKIPLVHHDFIIQGHTWSRTAAVTARYLQDKVSPQAAEEFRKDVFAHQELIANRDDLQRFTQEWFQAHGRTMPFVLDPYGLCAEEVNADCLLGASLGIHHTPTIVVVTAKQWIEVTEPSELYAAIDRAEAETAAPMAHPSAHK
jgi:protein-disulfide isomerase